MHTKREFMFEAFTKGYSVPIGIIGLGLTIMSTFQLGMEAQFSANTFWGWIWFLIALVILIFIALGKSVDNLNAYQSMNFNVGELPPVLSIKRIKDKEIAKIILHHKENLMLQKDAVVSIMLKDVEEGDVELGLGVVTAQQANGTIAIVATPKNEMRERWGKVLEKSSEYMNKLMVRTIIDRNYLNDDYLYQENYDILNLTESADQTETDGEGVKL